jgi:hypothetical protein
MDGIGGIPGCRAPRLRQSARLPKPPPVFGKDSLDGASAAAVK